MNIKKKDDLKEEENLNKTEDLEDFMRKSDDFSMEKKENMKKIEDLMRILDKINKRLGFQSLIENKRKSIGDIKDLLKTKEEFQDFIRKNEDFSAGKEEENLKKIEDLKKAEDLEKILEKINKRNGFQALIENKRKSIAAEDIKDELKTKEDFQDFIRKNEDFSVLKEEENLKKTEDLKNMKDLEKILDKINKRLGFQDFIRKIEDFSVKKQENVKKIDDLIRIIEKINERKGFQALIENQRKSIAAENIKDLFNRKITEDFKELIVKIQEFSIGKQENMKKVEDLMKILDKINKRLGFQALIKNQRKSIAAENFKDFLNKKITDEFDDFISKIQEFSIRKQENMKKVEDLMKILDKINKTKGFQALIKNQRKSIAAENFKNLFTIKIKETFEGFINKIEDFSMKKQENMKNIEDLEKILEKINKIQGFQALIENKRKSIAAENIKDFINKKIIEEFENFIKKIQEFSEKKQENMKNIEDLEKTLDKINKRQGFQTLIKYQRRKSLIFL